MNKPLLSSIALSATALTSTLGASIPLINNNNKAPEITTTTIKKTKFIAGKSSRQYFNLKNSNYVTGIERWYDAVEESCRKGDANISIKDFCKQIDGYEQEE